MSWRLLVTDNHAWSVPCRVRPEALIRRLVRGSCAGGDQHLDAKFQGDVEGIGALAISPNYATHQTIFAGTYDGGVFKSTNGGSSWQAMNAGLTDFSIQALALTPTTPPTLFAGTQGSSVWQYTIELLHKTYLPFIMKNH